MLDGTKGVNPAVVRFIDVSKRYKGSTSLAVDNVSFEIYQGEFFSILGPSGSGKTSCLRMIAGFEQPTSGQITLENTDLVGVPPHLRNVNTVFQNYALFPHMSIEENVSYPLRMARLGKTEIRQRTTEALLLVDMSEFAKRLPHQLSGGMRQRVMIAMALMNSPKMLIADEPTTALDVTVQAQILDLMKELQKEFNMAIILITHDLGVIAEAAQEVLVMYGGRIVEQSTVDALFSEPTHPYAWGLLGAVNSLELSGRGSLATIPGSPPSLISLPAGCSFNPRCAHSSEICTTDVPALRVVGSQGSVTACHLPNDEIISLGRKAAAR